MSRVYFAVLCMLTSSLAVASGNTLYFPTDYPTLRDAINAAEDGDTIFVLPGIYHQQQIGWTWGLSVNKNLTIIGECATTTRFRRSDGSHSYIVLSSSEPNTTLIIRNIQFDNRLSLHIAGNLESGGSRLEVYSSMFLGSARIYFSGIGDPTLIVDQCTFFSQVNSYDPGIDINDLNASNVNVYISNSCFSGFGPNNSCGIRIYGDTVPNLSCVNIHGCVNSYEGSNFESQLGVNGNISSWPGYCGYYGHWQITKIRCDSPCAPALSGCGTIGLFSVGCNDEDEFTILSAVSAQPYYHEGDIAHVSVEILNGCGANDDLTLGIYWDAIYDHSDDPPVSVSIPFGETQTFSSFRQIPPLGSSVEYSITAAIYKDGVVVNQRTFYRVFTATKLSQNEIDDIQAAVGECWLDYEQECLWQYIAIAPFISTVAHGVLFVENMCAAGELHRNGQWAEGWAAIGSGLLHFGWTALNTLTAGSGAIVQAIIGIGDVVGSGFEAASNCADAEFVGELFGNKSFRDQSFVESLVEWYDTAFNETGIDVANALYWSGELSTAVYADSSFATADSTGLNFVYVNQLEDIGGFCLITPNVHRFHDDIDNNPNSESEVVMVSQIEQSIELAFRHVDMNSDVVTAMFPAIDVTETSTLRLFLSNDMTDYRIGHDINSNGTVDYWHYEDGTVVGVSDHEVPSSIVRLTAYPNPFNPIVTIRLDMAQSGETKLAIHDLRGRVVRTLWTGHMSAGQHSMVWDGMNERGSQAASGVYLVRLVKPDGTHRAVKVTLSK